MSRGRSRRQFLTDTATVGLGAAAASSSWMVEASPSGDSLQEILRRAPRARHWISLKTPGTSCASCHDQDLSADKDLPHPRGAVRCLLCARKCLIPVGERGLCRARLNVHGELRSLVYGRPITIHVDPIEKKPFYHFLPGQNAFSLATSGCPLRCRFCQNWEISQAHPEDYGSPYTTPAGIVDAAVSRQVPIIAYTYNEPTVFCEYLLDIAEVGRKRGRRSVLISCGFMTEAPLAEMCEALDGIKIDLKGFSESFYRDVSSAELKPVLRSIKQVSRSQTHLELVNLVVPTLNDSEKMLSELCSWVMGELGPDVPLHFTRFHPDYQLLHLPPTPIPTLERARDMAMDKGIRHAFVGNVPGHPGNHTYCPKCKKIVILRQGFFVLELHLEDGRCTYCQTPIAGVWT